MASPTRSEDLPALTSLRFVAAMMIVIFHAKQYPFDLAWLKYAPGTLTHGVSFFFVLSGFILTHVYGSRPWPGYGRFIRLRFARLYPVHAFAIGVLVIAFFAHGAIIRPDSITLSGPGIFNQWVSLGLQLTMTQSLSPYPVHYFSWNAPAWTISTEFCFYLVFPALLVIFTKRPMLSLLGIGLATVAALSLISALPAGSESPYEITRSGLMVNPIFRVFEFCLGIATCVLLRRIKARSNCTAIELAALSLVVLAVSAPFLPITVPVPDFARQWTAVAGSCWAFAILIGVMALGQGAISRALAFRPFVFLGEISYSVYILHSILFRVFFTHGLIELGLTTFIVTLLAISAVTFLAIEQPARRWLTSKSRPAHQPA